MKKTLPFLLIMPLLVGCRSESSQSESIVPVNDDDASVVAKSMPFANLSADYQITGTAIDAYFLNGEDVPYIDVLSFLRSLDGFINCGESVRYQYYANKNMFVLSYYNEDKLCSYAQFQWGRNKIYVSDFSFFGSIIKTNQKTNYNSHLKYTNYQSWSEESVTFNLGTYSFDILYWKGKCLIPFAIANMLFCSQNQFNVFYTPSSFYGYYGEIWRGSDAHKTIYEGETNGAKQTSAMRKAAVNSFLFAMNYFYGLKSYKGIKGFKSYISSEDYDLLLSEDAQDNITAMKRVIYGQLDELHTHIDSPSIYSSDPGQFTYYLSDCGEFLNEYYTLKNQQTALRNETLGENFPAIRYSGDTAIITMDSFDTGLNEEIYDSDGNLKDTAWKYDSYYFMRHCMADIAKHTEVNDIVLDLSLNGGGNIGALKRTLGFLTDKIILDYGYDTLTNEYSCSRFKVDTDGDDYYDDDAYEQYRWTVLSSLNTFSAANNFVCKAKQQGLAKLIGHRSGGGMCSVLPLVLADGTAIAISSNNTSRYVTTKDGKDTYNAIEKGLSPDLEVPYSDYYDAEKLVAYVDSVYAS